VDKRNAALSAQARGARKRSEAKRNEEKPGGTLKLRYLCRVFSFCLRRVEGARSLLWVAVTGFSCFASFACSVYDSSLLAAAVAIGGADSNTSGDAGSADAVMASGGASTGGASTGGASTGGASTGGASTGGASAGGASTGGASTGGASTGGASTGGASTGGSGGTAGASAAGAAQGGGGGCGGDCQTLKATLVHRYSFNGTGVVVTDSVGGASGKAVNATLVGDGKLPLSGGATNAYVDLPNGIISALTNATFEAWLVWDGGDPWQRIFDFGSNAVGEDKQGNGATYLFLTPSAGSSYLRAAYSTSGNTAETMVQTSGSLTTGQSEQVALVVDDTNNLMSLYVDGVLASAVAYDGHLASLQDVNNWLGRSQFPDVSLSGSFDEFRIYGAALTAKQIMLRYSSGANGP